MVIQDGSGNVLAATKGDGSWTASSAGPITSDSVYNGETYDARLEQPGWATAAFKPGSDWKPAAAPGCFSPALSPRPFAPMSLQKSTPALSITPVNACPANTVGGMAAENSILKLTCAAGGKISNITFADFGTPSGRCGNFSHGSCTLPAALGIVAKLCQGQTSCAINASDTFFGQDPCYGTVKSLAVSGVGCSDDSSAKVVVDFGENLSGVTRIHVTGNAGDTVILRHAEVLQHPPYGPADGNIYVGNLRTALATDTYIMKGDPSGETYKASFTCKSLWKWKHPRRKFVA
jgi:hypothetical protein